MYRPPSAPPGDVRKLHLAAAAAVLALACPQAAVAQETPAYWLAPVSGQWSDAAKWSTGREPSGSPGFTNHAIIDVTGAAYTITTNPFSSAARLTLNSPDAVLVGSMKADEINVLAGAWRVPDKSTIGLARIAASGPGRIEFTQGAGTNAARSSVTFWNTTLASDLTVDGVAANVVGTMTLDHATLRVGRFGATGNAAGLTSTSSFSVAGTGTVEVGGTSTNGASLSSPGFITLAQGITVRAADGATARVSASINNYGTMQVDRPGTSLMLGDTFFNNYGTIRATAGTLTLDRINNFGQIHVSNAAVNFARLTNNPGASIVFDNAAASVGPPVDPFGKRGAISTAELDQVTWTGNSTLWLNATIDNTGKVFDTARYNVTFLAGDLVGGTFTSANPDVLTNSYKFTDVTLASDLNVRVGLTASGNLTLDNAILRFGRGPNSLGSLTQTGGGLRGAGRLVVASTNGARLFLGGDIDPGIAIDVADGNLVLGAPTTRANLTNKGAVTVSPGRTLTLYGGASFASQGRIDLGDNATFNVDGPFPLSNLGTVNRAANTTIIWGPTLDAAGVTIDLNATPVGPVELGRATFSNATLTAPGRNVNVFGNTSSEFGTSRASLNNITLAANLDIRTRATYVVTKGLTLAGGSIHFHNDDDQFSFSEFESGAAVGQVLSGAGELVFDAPIKTFGVSTAITTAGPLTIGPDVTLRTGDGSGRILGRNADLTYNTLTNNGTISARGAGRQLTIDATLVNTGTVEAADGAVLGLLAPFVNFGALRVTDATLRLGGASSRETFDGISTASNATVEITGSFDNTNRTIDVRDPARGITLTVGSGGTINGGTVVSADGTPLRVGGTVTFANAAFDAPVVVGGPGPDTLTVLPAAALRGLVTVEDQSTLTFNGARTDAPAVHANPGATVRIQGTTGKPGGLGSLANVALDNATLSLVNVTQPAAFFRPLTATNATVTLGNGAVVDNANDTLVAGGGKIDWLIAGGKITGGRVEGAAPDATLRIDTKGAPFNGSTLENVTVAASVRNESTSTIAGTFKMEPNHGAPVSLVNNGNLTFATGATATLDAPIVNTASASQPMTVTLLANARVRAHSINQGTLTVNAGAAFALAPIAEGGGVSRVFGVSLAPFGTLNFIGLLDLADCPLIMNNSTTVLARAGIAAAYANGAWTGPAGITSTYAATHPGTALGFASAEALLGITGNQTGTILGVTGVPSYATLIRLTRAGDANLDGVVNFDDLLQLAKNYNATPTADHWFKGDFNYDALVNFDDLLILAKNYNGTMPNAPWSVTSPAAAFPADLAAAFATAAVPEPSALGLLTLLAPFALKRRHRRRISPLARYSGRGPG